MTARPTTTPVVLRRLRAADDLAGALGLMSGYVAEIRRNLSDRHGLALEEATPDSELLVQIAGLLEPPQALYLAEVDGRPAGTGGLKEVRPGVAEVKRMYVGPRFRGRGIARALLERLIADARAGGYRSLQLETAVWMVEAHALYRSCGFTDAPPHPDPEFGAYPGLEYLARYMTLRLKELPRL
ncbi:MAG TPA: GNAT family N-acetyltransferase [Acidimicrobiia bacterium]|nr:GNAT family N-acetyltransferase [Acidimicrobiia bacterium]